MRGLLNGTISALSIKKMVHVPELDDVLMKLCVTIKPKYKVGFKGSYATSNHVLYNILVINGQMHVI